MTPRHVQRCAVALTLLVSGTSAWAGDDDKAVRYGKYLGQIEGVWPEYVNVTSEGQIIVYDGLERRFRLFELDGKEHDLTGTASTGSAREFQEKRLQLVKLSKTDDVALEPRPVDLVVTADMHMFVVDGANHRVVCIDLDDDEKQLWSIGGLGNFAGQFVEPTAIAFVPGANQLLVTDSQNHRVQAFNLDGEYLYEWGKHALVPRQGEGKIHYPNDIAISPDGAFVVVAEMFERRVQIFGPMEGGATSDEAPKLTIPDVQTHFGDVMAVDGRLGAVWEPEQRRVLVFDMGHTVPIHITTFGEYGTKLGQFTDIAGMAIDEENTTVYILDSDTRRIDVVKLNFDPEAPPRYDPLMASFVRSLPVAEALAPIEPELKGLTRLGAGTIAVVDAKSGALHEFDAATGAHKSWYLPEPGDMAYRPIAATFDPTRNRIIAIDEWQRSVLVYDADRAFDFGLVQVGTGKERLMMPVSVCVDDAGSIYVVDAGSDSVVKYDADGNFLTQWGGTGTSEGELWLPSAIGIDSQGRVVVLDYGNHRGQLFTTDGEWLATFSAGKARTRRLKPAQDDTATPD